MSPGLIARSAWIRGMCHGFAIFARLTRPLAVARRPLPLSHAWREFPTHTHSLGQQMANTASARKRIRQTKVHTARNAARKSRMRTFVKKVEVAISSGDKAGATAAFRAAQPEMQRASGKGVIHANTVARKLSRLSARIKALASA